MPEVNEKQRPRAFEPDRYQWHFGAIPETIERNGQHIPNPLRRSAVLVVHGMGDQSFLDTAIRLREGFENVIDELHRVHGLEKTPTPFTFEGYWGNYYNFERTFPDEWANFSEGEQRLFSRLWIRRSLSRTRTFFWFVKQALRLIMDPRVVGKVGPIRWLTYGGVVLLGLINLAYMFIRHPKILSMVLNDVRLYLEPKGPIEEAIVQRIDRRVGEQFLLLLGLDWNFLDLPRDKQLQVEGKPHAFTHVMWVAHSLGSVISYNVISDLFARCKQLRDSPNKPDSELSFQEREQQRNIARVEKGLHRYVTIGSPLEKIAFLFPKVLRPWPNPYLGEFAQIHKRRWWTNFFHIWDPVSGRLRKTSTYFSIARNAHSRLWRVPGWAHVSYWGDRKILTYIVTRAYGRQVLTLPDIPFMSEQSAEGYRRLSLLFVFPVTLLTFYLVATHWDSLWPVIKHWIGL